MLSPPDSLKPDTSFDDASAINAARTGAGFAGKRINLLTLAEAQRRMLLVFLVCLLVQLGLVFGSVWLPSSTLASVALGIVLGPIGIFGAIAIVAVSVRMAIAYGMHPARGVAWGLLLFVPFLGFVVLAILNQRVNDTLADAGVRLGLLGAGETEMHKLRIGVCRGCGYDLRGLPAPVCPECGKAIEA